MSGPTHGGRFELTATRARHWHKSRECECSALVEIAEAHLEGFRWEVGNGGNFLVVDQADESALFEAVSGRVSIPRRRWPLEGAFPSS